MIKFWRVVAYEYTRHVLRKRFIFALLSVPLFGAFMIGLVIVVVQLEMTSKPVGYVDYSGFLKNPVSAPKPAPPEKEVPILAFATEAEAEAALKAGKIQAYYVLPEDYLETSNIRLFYTKEPKISATQQFKNFIMANLIAGYPPEIAKRLSEGSHMTIQTLDGKRKMSGNDAINFVLPMIAAIVFFIGIFTSAGYLMQALVEEKENRTVEILVTSVSPNQLMAGKTVGIIGVGFTQLIVWGVFAVVAILVGRNYIEWMRPIKLDLGMVGLMAAVLLPAFVMLSAMTAAIGATVAEGAEGQQIVGFLSLPMWIPVMLVYPLMNAPNSPLAMGLSFFPLTAPLTILIRAGMTIIPTWQMVLGIGLLIVFAIGMLWFSGRAFRMGMLLYGKRLPWSEIFRKRERI
jgi:ABC-2 type transport system permease protein